MTTETKTFKFPCHRCGGRIQASADYVGRSIACPHCGESIVVAAPAGASPNDAGKERAGDGTGFLKKLSRILVGATVLAGLLLVGVAYWSSRRTVTQGERTTATPASGGAAATISPAGGSEAGAASPVPKSSSDLKAGEISLERQAKSSLIYAVGTVTNASDFQRFGVRLELEILDQAGRPAGRASDYARLIEPRALWNFRALMTDRHAAGARVYKISEDP